MKRKSKIVSELWLSKLYDKYYIILCIFFLQGMVWTTIQSRIKSRGQTKIRDIIDGKYYGKLCEEGKFLSNSSNISLIFNTDGAPLYSSSKVSLWPVFLAVNELPSPDR